MSFDITRRGFPEPNIRSIGYKLVDPNATKPYYDHKGDSGIALCSVETKIIKPNEIAMVDTGIQFDLPEGIELCVRSRSGMTKKHGIVVAQGVGTVDQNYRGNVFVLLHNISDEPFDIRCGMKIAQGVFNELPDISFYTVEDMSETSRGSDCLNSTGSYGIET